MHDLLRLDDLEARAAEVLPAMVRDYFAGGARDETTLRANRAAWGRLVLRHRVLVDVSRRSTATEVLGQRLASPILVAPTAFHRLAHPDGELATARAAARAGTAMVLSTLSTTNVEEVAAQGAPVWFQLYVYRDRGITAALVERAAAAGCRAIVLTADASILGTRERDVRNRFHLPAGITIRNAAPPGYATIAAGDGSGLAKWVSEALDPGVTWKDVEWLRSVTTLPILLKGVVRADDAARAADCGAAGIVVSNHGGRQLDGSPATADVLAEVVDAARGLEVLVDGGIRRGTDVLKALSLGARAVLVGRPVLWGLAVGGEDGVARVLAMLRDELDEAMALAGCPTVADATRDLVASAR